jgi:hypothetical protein
MIRIMGKDEKRVEISYIHYKNIDEFPRTEIILLNPERAIRYHITHADEIQIQYYTETI